MTIVSKRKELVDALMKAEIVKTVLFLIKMEQPVTMEEIARRCGVAKGTLYNYFKDKKALLHYVHQTILAPIREKNNVLFRCRTGNPLDTLHEFIDDAFDVEEDVALYFHFIQRKRTVASQNDERFELIMRPLIDFCRRGIQEGFFMNADPLVLAEMIYGTVIGTLISMRCRDCENTDREKIKQDVMRLVDRLVVK